MSSKKTLPKGVQKHKRDNSASILQTLLRKAVDNPSYRLRLYITGTTPRSTQAIANIRSLCDEYLPGRYDLEVVDIYQQPAQAAQEQIIAAPTLVKTLPAPPKRMIGNLSDRARIVVALGLKAKETLVKAGIQPADWVKI